MPSWLLICGASLAGPYSSGLGNTNPGAIDEGIAGKIDGVVNPAFVGWASAVSSYLPAPGVDPGWNHPARALGPVTGDNFDIVSLGDLSAAQIGSVAPGQITLEFKRGIADRPGPDFAVFENGFGAENFVLGELAYVEVSSDGSHFVRFSSTSLTPAPVGPYGSIDPTDIHNLAGKHVNAYGNSWGTPFDLSDLPHDPALNPNGVRYIRLIDIPGNGSFGDSQENPIYDAWLTFGSGGFDLEAIGVLHDWLAGDANLDGQVDITDLATLATNWQTPQSDFTAGDFDLSGYVDITDLSILATNWQHGAIGPVFASLVPEPAAAGGVGLAALALLARRLRKLPVAALLLAAPAGAATANLEDVPVAPGSFYNGSDSAGGFTSAGVHFANGYDTTFASWSGFACSNVNNTTTPGYANQYAAFAGAGHGGAGNYAVAFDPGAFGVRPTITLPYVTTVTQLYVTNTTYAYLAIRDGNDGFGAVRQFGDDPNVGGNGNQGYPDWFKLTITGSDGDGQTAGTVDFYLADYRFADNAADYVIADWTAVDLSSLGPVRTLALSLSSSDVGAFGINTPTYLALDDLTFVPEPAVAAALAGVLLSRRRR